MSHRQIQQVTTINPYICTFYANYPHLQVYGMRSDSESEMNEVGNVKKRIDSAEISDAKVDKHMGDGIMMSDLRQSIWR